MIFEEFLSEIRGSMEQYDSAGLIDKMTVHNLVIDGLNTFGVLPTIRTEAIINIKNNSGKLPATFKSLYSAVKCEPYKCTIEEDQAENILQDFYFFKVRELKNEDWNFCNPCDIEETETCVVEKVYLHNNIRANFYYNNVKPIKLKLATHVKRTKCDKDCINFNTNDALDEISIQNKTLYTNFKEGKVFMIFNGYEEDEDGFIDIPETEEGNLMKYLVAYVKKRIIERIMTNSDNNTNEQFLYSIYDRDENLYQAKASGEMKLKKVLASMDNYRRKIKREFAVYDFGNYSHNYQKNKIEFIVL